MMKLVTTMCENFAKETKLMREAMEAQSQDHKEFIVEMKNLVQSFYNDDEVTENDVTQIDTEQSQKENSTDTLRTVNENTENDLTFKVRDELKRLGFTNLNNNPTESNSLMSNVKEAIKFEFINKESGIKRDYKLTAQTKFDYFFDYLTSELRERDLLYVIDSTTTPNSKLNDETKEKQKF